MRVCSNLDREEKVEQLKKSWRSLWRERIDDKVRGEGIANDDYSELFVDQGTVIFATRDFKPLSLRNIMEEHGLDADRHTPPDPEVGGWGKFIRNQIPHHSGRRREEARKELERKKEKQHRKNGGYGWLHR